MSSVDREYPTELNDEITLADRTRIRVRALRRFEDGPIRELFDHLSPRTRYLRFLSPLRTLPESLVTRLASVDYCRQVALVAEHHCGDRHEVVAIGSFGAVDDQRAEVALVVRDDWQRRRIGTELAKRVLAAAEGRGFHRFVAHVSSTNVAIERVLRHVGHVVGAAASGGMSELIFIRR